MKRQVKMLKFSRQRCRWTVWTSEPQITERSLIFLLFSCAVKTPTVHGWLWNFSPQEGNLKIKLVLWMDPVITECMDQNPGPANFKSKQQVNPLDIWLFICTFPFACGKMCGLMQALCLHGKKLACWRFELHSLPPTASFSFKPCSNFISREHSWYHGISSPAHNDTHSCTWNVNFSLKLTRLSD